KGGNPRGLWGLRAVHRNGHRPKPWEGLDLLFFLRKRWGSPWSHIFPRYRNLLRKGRSLPAPRYGRHHGKRPGRRRSEEHTSELQSRENLVCRLLLEKKKATTCEGYCDIA